MNPFARWLDHARFQCNFCGATSECPREYMCNLGADGRRMDWAQRPELCRGSVEYAAPGTFLFTFVWEIRLTSCFVYSGVHGPAPDGAGADVLHRCFAGGGAGECSAVSIPYPNTQSPPNY